MMKLFALAAAVAVTLSAGAASTASAQTRERVVTHKTTTVTRHVETRRHHGWRTKRVCKIHWVHHRKVRRCRTIRVRR